MLRKIGLICPEPVWELLDAQVRISNDNALAASIEEASALRQYSGCDADMSGLILQLFAQNPRWANFRLATTR